MKNNKFIALILSFSLILSLFSFQSADADNFNAAYQAEMDFLKSLGLIEKDYDATLVITKAEILTLILNTLYPDADFSKGQEEEQIFNDVSENHEYYSYIKTGKDLGIVNGDGNNNFHPDKQMILNQAIAVVVNALGYRYHAQQLGGYPSGYYMIAKQIGLLKNVNLAASDTVNGGDVVRIIYNSLFTNIIEMILINSDGVQIKANYSKNVLSERFSVYEYDGVVIDNGISCIEGDSIGNEEKAVVKNIATGDVVSAYISDTKVDSYLGCRVKAYVKNNLIEGKNEFVYVTLHGSVNTTSINAKDIIDANDYYIEYDEDINTIQTKKIRLSEIKPVVMFNGIKIVDKTIKELIPNDGYINFIDNTGDDIFDVVMIYSFNYYNGAYNNHARNIIADSIITTPGEEGISCLFNPAISVELNESEYLYTFILNSDYKSLSDLKNGLVVSVAEAPAKINGKTYYMLAVSDNTVTGKLTSVENNRRLYMSNNEYYDLSTSLTGIKPTFANSLKIGSETEILVDITGNVAYVKTETSATKNYAYIVKAVEKFQGDQIVLVKFFTKEGQMRQLPLSDKAIIDGVSVASMNVDEKLERINKRPDVASELTNAKATGRPAIISVNNDKITRIDTDTPNPGLSSGKISETYVQQSVIQYYEDDADSYDTLKAGFRSPRAATVRGTAKTVGGKYFITSETVILCVPEIDTYAFKNLVEYRPYGFKSNYFGNNFNADPDMILLYELPNEEKNYQVINASQLYAAYSLDLQGYDIDPDTGVAGLVVVRGRRDAYRSGSVSASAPMSVYIKKTEAYDSSLEKNVTKIYYWENGQKLSATIDTDECYYPYKALINGCSAGDTPHNVAVKPLKNGDIIRVIQSGGKITHIERVLRIEDYESAHGSFHFSKSTSVPYANSVSGSDSTFPFDMTVLDDNDNISVETSNSVALAYATSLKGTTLQLALTKEYRDLFSAIDISNPLSYSKLYYNVTTDNITVIDIPDDGSEVEIQKGTLNDIVTLQEVNNNTSEASVIMTKIVDYNLDHIIIINGLENL